MDIGQSRGRTLSLAEARLRVSGQAEPGESIEVALTEAQGLALAEPITAGVDLPPFDRASVAGYAARAVDAPAGATLRLVGVPRGGKTAELLLDPGEAARVSPGDALPVGADVVVRVEDAQPDPADGPAQRPDRPPRRGTRPGRRPSGLLPPRGGRDRVRRQSTSARGRRAARGEGCVHPVCYRRGPRRRPRGRRPSRRAGRRSRDAPRAERRRPDGRRPLPQPGADHHDLGAVSERDLPQGLHTPPDRARRHRPGRARRGDPPHPQEGGRRADLRGGLRPPRDAAGLRRRPRRLWSRRRISVIHMTPSPAGVLTGVALLVVPLIDRLHGGPAKPGPPLLAVWSGPTRTSTDNRAWAVPVTLRQAPDARLTAEPVDHRGKDDLPSYARAEALAVFPQDAIPGSPAPWSRSSRSAPGPRPEHPRQGQAPSGAAGPSLSA